MTKTGEAGSGDRSSKSRTGRRLLLAGLAATIAALLVAPGARAAEVTYTPPGEVRFIADVGVEDDVTVTAHPGSVTIEVVDDTISVSSALCTGNATATVVCTAADPSELTGVRFALGDMDDSFSSSGTLPVTDEFDETGVDAGPGDDTVTHQGPAAANLFGGPGNDRLSGGPGRDYLFGGPGNDHLTGGAGSDKIGDQAGTDVSSGGSGDDLLQDVAGNGDRTDGGSGDDAIVAVFGGGEGDSTQGGPGTDLLLVADFNLAGTDGGVIDLAAGVLTLRGESGAIAGVEDVVGYQGPDTITGDAGPNRITSAVDAHIFGMAQIAPYSPDQGDTVDPGAGSDFVTTGTGADSVHVVDGSADRVACGPGHDTVQADQLDLLTDCEAVSRTEVPVVGALQPPPPAPFPAPPAAIAPADTTRPNCSLAGISKKARRRAFLRGPRVRVRCNEAVRVEATLSVRTRPRRGGAVIAAAGDLILAERLKGSPSARQAVRLRPPGKLGRQLPKRFRARLRIVARDAAGNATSLVRAVRVLPDKSKRKQKRARHRTSG